MENLVRAIFSLVAIASSRSKRGIMTAKFAETSRYVNAVLRQESDARIQSTLYSNLCKSQPLGIGASCPDIVHWNALPRPVTHKNMHPT